MWRKAQKRPPDSQRRAAVTLTDSPAFFPFSIPPRRRPWHRGPVAAEGKVPGASFTGVSSGEGGHSFPQRPLRPFAGTMWITVLRGSVSGSGRRKAGIHYIGGKGEEAMPVPALPSESIGRKGRGRKVPSRNSGMAARYFRAVLAK